ncbi:hypothetical protein L2E82_16182 [Cichorium intybus]|uniref:Uncharacterized protein n=1 Tax=Cichorium intybus TaxID=13427 RepID=A0ACB9F4T8_CICIN|nr:hypothetical protein L2E82_16182 [Cichorium intybus]
MAAPTIVAVDGQGGRNTGVGDLVRSCSSNKSRESKKMSFRPEMARELGTTSPLFLLWLWDGCDGWWRFGSITAAYSDIGSS